jgi:hypothetical protein
VDAEFIIGLEGDHSTLVKLPNSFKEKRYERISDVLEKFVAAANIVVVSRFQILSDSLNSGTSEGPFAILRSAKRSCDTLCADSEKELARKQTEQEQRREGESEKFAQLLHWLINVADAMS